MNEKPLLISMLNQGQEEGLKAIYQHFKRSLLYFSLQFVDRPTSEEIVSDTFIKIWDKKEQFESIDKLKAFMFIVTKNSCLNYLKKQSTNVNFESIDSFEAKLSEEPTVYSKIIKSELLNRIYQEVNKLPKTQQKVFQLSFFEDFTVEEIVEKLNISPSAVYTHRSKAIARLKKNLNSDEYLFLLFLLNFLIQK